MEEEYNFEDDTFNDTIEDVKHDFDKLVNDVELNDIEETKKDNLIEENKNDIKEFNIMDTLEESSSISINDPTNEQYEIYKKAVEEARFARQKAMEAYMNAKNIKAQYLFNLEIDSESDEDDLEISVN